MIRKPASASGMRGREHDVERQRRRAARLEQQQPPQLVALGARGGASSRASSSPGTSSTPPTTIRLGSPSAWASTQWRTRPRTAT